MTVRFGRPAIDYQPDGIMTTDDGEVEYRYSPVEETNWYETDSFLALEHRELDAVKVMV